MTVNLYGILFRVKLLTTIVTIDTIPFELDNDPINLGGAGSSPFAVTIWAHWNMEKLIFSNRETIGRRIGRQNQWGERQFRATVVALFQERRRLLFEAFTEPGDERSQLFRDLRIEELTAHLNALAGNIFESRSAL